MGSCGIGGGSSEIKVSLVLLSEGLSPAVITIVRFLDPWIRVLIRKHD